jgi:hypothetical protein
MAVAMRPRRPKGPAAGLHRGGGVGDGHCAEQLSESSLTGMASPSSRASHPSGDTPEQQSACATSSPDNISTGAISRAPPVPAPPTHGTLYMPLTWVPFVFVVTEDSDD